MLSEACAQLLWACPTLWDPIDYSPPGSSVHGILQASILEWVAMPSSRVSSWPRDRTCVSCVSCIAGRFLTHWATWEAPFVMILNCKLGTTIHEIHLWNKQKRSLQVISANSLCPVYLPLHNKLPHNLATSNNSRYLLYHKVLEGQNLGAAYMNDSSFRSLMFQSK